MIVRKLPCICIRPVFLSGLDLGYSRWCGCYRGLQRLEKLGILVVWRRVVIGGHRGKREVLVLMARWGWRRLLGLGMMMGWWRRKDLLGYMSMRRL